MINKSQLDNMKIGTVVNYDIMRNVEFLGVESDGIHVLLNDATGKQRRFYVSLFLKYCTIINLIDKEKMKEVKNLIADSVILTCPYCKHMQSDFDGNPSGEVFECVDCGKVYKVNWFAHDNISI